MFLPHANNGLRSFHGQTCKGRGSSKGQKGRILKGKIPNLSNTVTSNFCNNVACKTITLDTCNNITCKVTTFDTYNNIVCKPH